ncbi:hypothetical protein [Fusibacter sp. JL216-2]|uniref:hypothetical protein n=1 Tax=Fusibacter sp. JL216-2 TaxID=3071453 RepID=UPI003D34207C
MIENILKVEAIYSLAKKTTIYDLIGQMLDFDFGLIGTIGAVLIFGFSIFIGGYLLFLVGGIIYKSVAAAAAEVWEADHLKKHKMQKGKGKVILAAVLLVVVLTGSGVTFFIKAGETVEKGVVNPATELMEKATDGSDDDEEDDEDDDEENKSED